jgi:hypothetical protein
MKNRLFILTIMLGICGFTARSQTLSPTVVSSSGGFYSNGSGMLSFTVAEMTMVQTFTSPGNILTQGFQQPEDYVTAVNEIPTASGDVLIYPNPTNGSFTLSYVTYDNIETTLKLYNMLGQIILSKPISQIAGQNTVNFDISALSQGIYLLELITINSKGEKNTAYHKINLQY